MVTITDEVLAELPEPVARSLRHSGVVGSTIPKTVAVRQTGEILLRGRWMPFTADEDYRVDVPWFHWRGTVRLAGVPIARADDSFDGQSGHMKVRLLGMVQVVDAAGPEMDQGALMRWLNETMWFPQVWATDVVRWQPIDDTSALGAVTAGDLTVEAEFRFDTAGRLIDFRADRYQTVDSGFDLTPWATPISEHSRFDGIEVPSCGIAVWNNDGGDLEYIRIRIADVAYQ